MNGFITLRELLAELLTVRFVVETLLLAILSIVMVVIVCWGATQFADVRVQYFLIGYYIAIHNDLVRRIWKRLRIEKAAE